jgi:hypothetical protein
MRYRDFGVPFASLLVVACASHSRESDGSRPARELMPETAREVHAAALRSARFYLNLPAPFCIALERGDQRHDPDDRLLSAVSLDTPAVPMSRCPPTYGSMVRFVDSAGRPIGPQRPPGYLDPYRLALSPVVPIVRNLVAVRIDASQGTQLWLIYCEAVPAAPVHASCGVAWEGVS